MRAYQAGSSGAFGSVPLMWGTFFIGAIIAMIVAVPLGLMSAIYLTQYAPPRVRSWLKPILEILAGVPTVVYGYFAALTVAPVIRDFGLSLGISSASSESALAAGLVRAQGRLRAPLGPEQEGVGRIQLEEAKAFEHQRQQDAERRQDGDERGREQHDHQPAFDPGPGTELRRAAAYRERAGSQRYEDRGDASQRRIFQLGGRNARRDHRRFRVEALLTIAMGDLARLGENRLPLHIERR